MAHYAAIPVHAVLGGSIEVVAGLVVNLATHPRFRRRGLLVSLACETNERARREGLDHLVVVANRNSTPILTNRLQFSRLAQLDVFIGFGYPRATPGSEASPVSWQRAWRETDLVWRLNNPAARYRHRRVDPCLAIVAPNVSPGISAVMKVGYDRRLNQLVEKLTTPIAFSGLIMWIGHTQKIRRPPLAARLPTGLRPSPLNLLTCSLSNGRSTPKPEHVHFEAIDFDAY